jgi:hypothetical protein
MRICVLPFGVLCAVTLFGQKSSNSKWQNSCFNNPGLPYCQGRDFAVKNKTAKNSGNGANGTASGSLSRFNSRIDWRFADPSADALMGMNFSALAASPLARNLLAMLGAKQNVSEADMKKIFEGFGGIDEIAVSARENGYVVMLVGGVKDLVVPTSAAGTKSLTLSGTAMLFGTTEAVDQAAQRIGMAVPLSELATSAQEGQATSEFWAIGSGRSAGARATSAGIKRYWLTVAFGDDISSDIAYEFDAPPSAKTLESLTMPGATVEGNVAHASASVKANEVLQKFGNVVPSLLGERLGTLVGSARQLPMRDINVLKETRPVIYGLDNGPKVVGQQP